MAKKKASKCWKGYVAKGKKNHPVAKKLLVEPLKW